jgi:hypothetical protein
MAREKTIAEEFALAGPTTTFDEPGIKFDVLNVSEPNTLESAWPR